MPDGNTFDAFALAREIVASPEFQQEAARERALIVGRKSASGVCWSGLTDAPYQPRTVGQMALDAMDAQARREAHERSPNGRFIAAVRKITADPEKAKHHADAWAAHDAWSRGFASHDKPANQAEIGVASLALSAIPGKAAIEAREALAELLIQTSRKVA